MEEKIAMLMSLILVVLISNFTLNMVAAESYCHGQCRVLVNACKRLILRQSPTAECCLRIRRTPMWCLCSIITPQLAALVNANDVSDAVGVICQCGRPVARSTKCGSKRNRRRRNRRRRNHKILIDIVCVYFLFVELTLCRDTLFSPLSSCPKSEVFNRLFAIVFSAVFAAFLSASSSFLKQKKVKTQNEFEAATAGKGSSEKECSKDLELENKATLTTIVSTLDNISRKFDQIGSRLEAYELDRNRPLMDQKTIDDRVKALLEERLKDLGVGEISENNDNPSPPLPVVQTQQKSINSPALAATPGKVFGLKKNLAKELDKESGVKMTLDEEFGSVAKATDLDSQPLDFVVISPAKATKDDKDAKVPAYGHGCWGNRIVKGEEADEKKKAAQADAAFKRKEKAEAKKKAAKAKKKEAETKKKKAEGKKKKETEGKKKEAEAKKKEAEGKKKQEAEGRKKEAELKKKQEAELKKRKQAESKNKEVTPSGEDSVFADVTDEVVGGERTNSRRVLRSRDLNWLDLP
ncbi:hypothetical protein F2Q69_00042470 [Brassica cretica]|uniref:Bifunctional inhibitor/plant lipid transfer protein/seed storage helical domain-containing protein n=1 Tax=Brassica cretica TaxID=69181 RepID=A0A8S9N5Z3_BRACR|nr:hypothetical protein F2Q69_00042470 [Brassica cretica]